STSDFIVAFVVKHTTPADAGGVPYGALYSKQIADVSPYNGVGLFANTPSGSTGFLAQLNANGASELTSTSTGYNNGSPFVVVLHRASVTSDAGGGTD